MRDQRHAADEYVYGKEPNDFFAEVRIVARNP